MGKTVGGPASPGLRLCVFQERSVLRILKLPPNLVNQIAAGEVIERPSSVVKELTENAIDAGASRVEITIEEGGTRLIRVADDGDGIVEADLHLAVCSHATSKIRETDDLFSIRSLGFRGEALASIAAVSHLEIASRRRGEGRGAELKVSGGEIGAVRPTGLPEGTTVEVCDLFFNIPARRAFLRTEGGEARAAIAEIKRQALARPDVAMRVVTDGKTVLEAAATDEPRERIAQLLGRDLGDDLLALATTEAAGMRLRGYVSPCDRSFGNSRQQFFFLNGRAIRDVTLLTAVRTAYADLLPPRRHPIALLWLDVDPEDVDVNVHPQKSEVRFRHDREVFRLVVKAIQETLQASGLVRELRLPRHEGAPLGEPTPITPRSLPFPLGGAPLESAPLGEPHAAEVGRPFLQVHRRYVVEETPEGIRIVDPHALHERILYEQIVTRLERESLESQRFLFPQIVDVSPGDLLALGERGQLLTSLGFDVTAFGANALAIHAAPRLLQAERATATLRHLLEADPRRDPQEERPGLLHDLAASLACRSAVRFGDALPDGMIDALLTQRAQVPRGHCCPHGRPTALALSLDELDRRFGRQGFSK